VKKIAVVFFLALSSLLVVFMVARAADRSRRINLPTSKSLTLPAIIMTSAAPTLAAARKALDGKGRILVLTSGANRVDAPTRRRVTLPRL